MLDILALIQISFAFIGVSPFLFYWIKMKTLSQHPMKIPPEPEIWPSLTIVLPVRNEEIVLKKKLENLENQEYPIDKIELIVIDSNSNDSTLEVLEKWNTSRKSNFPLSTIIMDEYLGKSAAINRILEENFDSDAMVITDADALLARDSLKRIGRWLSEEKIGAVCGSQKIIETKLTEHLLNEKSYRSFYHDLRIGESSQSSTPIFEGSLAAYRNCLLEGKQIDSTYNADDSQLAILIHREGGRSIMDPELHFFESIPSSKKSANRRRIRRASGLVHLFTRNRIKGFDSKFSSILRNESWAHLFMPFFVFISVASMLCHIFYSTHLLISEINFDNFHIFLLLTDSLFLLCLLLGNQIQLGRILRSFLSAQYTLLLANTLMYLGKDYRYWNQDTESRISMIKDLE
ncbi:MAG: glycosyltransferase [Candidatus Thermoplasmatota archaeon]|nr:glycosyltransferase [Candidatus Thermoplasmatota archaeon]